MDDKLNERDDEADRLATFHAAANCYIMLRS